MPPLLEGKVGVELAVDAAEQVDVELGRYALAVRVGALDDVDVLLEVKADEGAVAGAITRDEYAAGARRAPGRDVAQGRARRTR